MRLRFATISICVSVGCAWLWHGKLHQLRRGKLKQIINELSKKLPSVLIVFCVDSHPLKMPQKYFAQRKTNEQLSNEQ
jgi:hypothetical protein